MLKCVGFWFFVFCFFLLWFLIRPDLSGAKSVPELFQGWFKDNLANKKRRLHPRRLYFCFINRSQIINSLTQERKRQLKRNVGREKQQRQSFKCIQPEYTPADQSVHPVSFPQCVLGSVCIHPSVLITPLCAWHHLVQWDPVSRVVQLCWVN